MTCTCCPRNCGVDRERAVGFCGAKALPNIALASLHHWEEPCISGSRGSGAIFFCGCNMRCVFCQNFDISNKLVGEPADVRRLADIMLRLQGQGAHNINLVTPAPHIAVILPAVELAREGGLTIPIVYNTNGYETEAAIASLKGYVDIYLPDFKYVSPVISSRYSACPDYAKYAEAALVRMYEQVGRLSCDGAGIAKSGLIVRHLVLPGAVAETKRVLKRLSQLLPLDTSISLMGQYVPFYRAAEYGQLNRRLLKREYERAVDYALSLGFTELLIQSLCAADGGYTPSFDGSAPA